MSLVARNNAKSVPKPRSKRRKIARFGLFTVIGFVILGALLWMQRSMVAEWVIRNTLSEHHIDADLSISKLSGSGAIIDQIHLSVDGVPFFSASKVTADYQWRKAIKGRIQRVEIERPKLFVEIDENGKLISPVLPQSEGTSGNSFILPPEGMFVNDGEVILKTPFGDVTAEASGLLLDTDQFEISGVLRTENLERQGISGQGYSSYAVTRKQGVTNLVLDTTIPNLRTETLSGQNLRLNLNNKVLWDDTYVKLEGPITAKFGAITSPEFEIGAGSVSSTGVLNIPLPGAPENARPLISTVWGIDISDFTLTHEDRRAKLADTLALNRTLSGISSTAPFAPALKRQAEEMLKTVDLKGSGHFDLNTNGMVVVLSEPFTIGKETATVTLSPANETPFYEFDPSSKRLKLNFQADVNGTNLVIISNAELKAHSLTGFDIAAIKNFTGSVQTKNTWRARTLKGQRARLAPLKATVNYKNDITVRHVSMTGALDYDGDIPGGYVKGLTTRGNIRLRLSDEDITAWYKPTDGTQVKIKELNTVSDWIAKDLNLTLTSSAPVYKRDDAKGRVKTSVINGSGKLIHKTRDMDMAFDFAQADIAGTMTRKDGETVKQVWDVNATTAHMMSDTIPAIGTDIQAPELAMTATLAPDTPLYFTALSPSIDVVTPQMRAANLKISAAGTSENLRAEYEGGNIVFTAMPLPPLPITGFATYSDGIWSGEAKTYLEQATDTPIDVNYTFENGQGRAIVTVKDLPFTPRGLQPKHLLPAFGGKVAQVKGFVDAKIIAGFGGDQPLTTSATATLKDMSMGTLPGPITGLNAELSFSSLYPPETDGPQTLTLSTFDPGIPLEKGTVSFGIIPDGIDIHSARWPMGDGVISLDPTEWRYSKPENRMTLRVEGVALSEFLQGAGGDNFKVTGDVTGELPVIISGVNVLVDNGVLRVKNGGVIQYSSPQTNAASDNNEVAGYAFDALKNFEYKSLEAKLNGPLDGEIDLRMIFAGRNREVLGGAEFLFNVGVQGQLFNIARSFQTGKGITATVKDEIARRNQAPN